MQLSSKFAARTVRRGLTLIELVVVIAILAVLASMIIPRLDFLKDQAEHASSASTQADVGTLLQTYKASSGKYPTFDTLIDTSGALYSKLQGQTALSGLEVWAPPSPGAGATHFYRSLSEAGFSYGYTHDAASTDASNSATNVVDLINQIFDGSLKLATIKSTGGGTNATAVRNAIYPGGTQFQAATDPDGIPGNGDETTAQWVQVAAGTIPADRKLVVFGLGPKSNATGNILVSAPLGAAGSDDSKATYCRYLVVFEVYGTATNTPQAKFKMVTDHRLRQIGSRVDQYKSGNAAGG